MVVCFSFCLIFPIDRNDQTNKQHETAHLVGRKAHSTHVSSGTAASTGHTHFVGCWQRSHIKHRKLKFAKAYFPILFPSFAAPSPPITGSANIYGLPPLSSTFSACRSSLVACYLRSISRPATGDCQSAMSDRESVIGGRISESRYGLHYLTFLFTYPTRWTFIVYRKQVS